MLGIVYGVLNSTVFSAKSVAQSYLTAIADGKYGKANGIADPQVGKDQLKLLSDTVAKADNATIANPHIDSVKTVEGVAKVNVTYSLNGKNVNDSLTINKDGSKFLLFPNWKVSSPLLKTITVSVPNAVESLSVNGVDVTAKNAEKSDSGTWTLRVYPVRTRCRSASQGMSPAASPWCARTRTPMPPISRSCLRPSLRRT